MEVLVGATGQDMLKMSSANMKRTESQHGEGSLGNGYDLRDSNRLSMSFLYKSSCLQGCVMQLWYVSKCPYE